MSQTDIVQTDSIEQEEQDRKKPKKQKSRRPASMLTQQSLSCEGMILINVAQIPPSDSRG
jgi:hypothetical protein